MDTSFDYHIESFERPWNAETEPVTGCDALFSRLQAGWQIVGTVCAVEIWFNRRRRTHILNCNCLTDANAKRCVS